MGLWKEGLGAMFKRYKEIWKAVWNIREQLDPPKRDEDERAFLPAQLELVETPLSNAPKWAARLIMLFFVITLLWAILGHMEVVATAQGKTVLSGRSKAIKSLEDGGIVKIYVKNGDEVKKDDPLVTLDFLGADQDYEKAEQSLEAATLLKYRSEALIKALQNQEMPLITEEATERITIDELKQAEQLVQNQYQLWQSQDDRYGSAIRQKDAEYRTTNAQVEKLTQNIELIEEELQDYEKLSNNKSKGVSKHQYNQKRQDHINAKHELVSQESRLIEINEGKIQLEKERQYTEYQLKQEILNGLREAQELVPQYLADSQRAKHRMDQAHIKAPANGTVQQLNIHTEGGVVSHGEELMVIVPEGDFMEVEALVPNKDIGFIEHNQEVVIKVESFPYTRYGYITGRVKSISFDAIEHQDYGLVYQAIIKLDKDFLMINEKKIPLTAGMNVTAEIKIRERRVIDYFLSPLQTKVGESMREL
ncbi:leukotoxin secretion protein D [Wohlfahrtiimonas chitiniclastica]|uniref:Membrane fusion protein (MFP) family protein n=1 Tax=Wohlfahrtiimonas chitiniclastica SH04 TaxID=1261130 RepID=L8XYJ2_9GAMM|nr:MULTISPECIES: HlyD family type I secretion periplasmic adaptor subunit [Wohlfahrtiimonas]ELV07884.1 Leukotoxin secretion protein D [Wohlfahrtiimonas chitiniclastica SH04]KZX37303.1 leukotoxin secretion protein D [Wohlfahrtiimonas chitiniclastica]MBS7814585.1 HlyD family type I secretion periplasmic adaptor subunit [Wohlfahrtiimonas chitiniclastica]MBS7818253.1 HlyD family type I secretion periplasmic adaptor subunit [Wohlfahrtiimonas chitiniclastica]MBS7820475.1 HlyD family type I secretion